MKKCEALLISLLVLASLSSYATADAGGKTTNSSIMSATENTVILKNEVLLIRDASNYTECDT